MLLKLVKCKWPFTSHYSWWPWLWQLSSKHAPISGSSWPCFPERLPLVHLQQRRHLPVNVSSLGHPRYAQQWQLCQSSLHARKWDLCRFGGDCGRRDWSPHSAHCTDLPLQAHEKQRAFSISALCSAGAAGWRRWWSPSGLMSLCLFILANCVPLIFPTVTSSLSDTIHTRQLTCLNASQ